MRIIWNVPVYLAAISVKPGQPIHGSDPDIPVTVPDCICSDFICRKSICRGEVVEIEDRQELLLGGEQLAGEGEHEKRYCSHCTDPDAGQQRMDSGRAAPDVRNIR